MALPTTTWVDHYSSCSTRTTPSSWSDPKVSGPYGLWLQQIARHTATAKMCMSVVGVHQPHGQRTVQRPAFCATCDCDPSKTRGGDAEVDGADEDEWRGVPREHHRDGDG